MKRFLTMSVVVLAVAGAPAMGLAQTGPTGPSGAPTTNNAPVAQNGSMTPDRLSNLLRQDGHKVEVKDYANGGKTVIATVQRDGWQFVIEFEFMPGGKVLNVVCPLGNSVSQVAPAQLMALMKKNYELPGCTRFSYRNGDQRICLEDPNYNPSVNFGDQLVRNIVDGIVRTVRDTQNLWDTSRWPLNGGAPIAASPPVPPQVGAAPALPK
jgi:hypothetical protein